MISRDDQRELMLIASILDSPGQPFPPALRELFEHAREVFRDPIRQRIADAIHRAAANGHIPAYTKIHEHLSPNDSLAFCELVGSAGAHALPLGLAEHEAAPLLDRVWRRAVVQTLADAYQAVTRDESRALSISQHVVRALSSVCSRSQRPDVLPEIEDATLFVAREFKRPTELVRGVAHLGEKLVLGGASKSFKTWTLLDLAVSVATGSIWLGFECHRARVLFVNFEIQNYHWQRRIVKVTETKGVTLDPNTFMLLNLRGKLGDFKSLLPSISAVCRNEDYGLIVLDPIYKLYGGKIDENKATDVAELLHAIEMLATQTGACVAFGAHFSKGNQAKKEAQDRISGSGVFARDPDALLLFTPHQERDCFVVEPILRNFPPVDPFAVRFSFPLFERAPDLDPSAIRQPGGRPAAKTDSELLRAIEGTSEHAGITIAEWARKVGMNRTALIGRERRLREMGLIGMIGSGYQVRRFLTDAGRDFLASEANET